MNKKIIFATAFIFAVFAAFYYFVIMKNISNDDKNINQSSIENNSNKTQEKELIGEFNNIKLYITDYKYNKNINGYNYVEVPLTQNIIDNIKNDLYKVDLKDEVNDIVYGQYKLVIDNKIIFYDINTNSALYLDENIVFNFPNEIKLKLNQTTNTCTCCSTSNCNINLCACK